MHPDPSPPQHSILIVDDKPENLRLLSRFLVAEQYEVHSAINGQLALEGAKNLFPSLILLDIMMPGMDGYEVCQRLKSDPQTASIPIIFISAIDDVLDKVRAFSVGGVDYITKPFQFEEVLARVKHQLTIQALQNQLTDQNQKLQESLEKERELNEMKSRFVSMVSHEFKNPLTGILTDADLLANYATQLSEEEKKAHYLQIKSAIQRLSQLIDEVLTLGRADAGYLTLNPNRLDLKEFCRDLVKKLQAGIGKQHFISFQGKSTSFDIIADRSILEHIFTNLLSNAIKYSEAGTIIDFELSQKEGWYCFRITDEGIGIPLEDQPHLFEAFFRAKNVGTIQGTGLGLSIVKQMVELHGGTIFCRSQPGIGTEFTVTLPGRIST